MHTKTPDTQTFEAVVVGAGLVGLTLAHALASAGIEVAVIDHADPKTFTETAFDGRTTAVAEGSVRVLEGIGLWQDLKAEACPIETIRVSDGDALMFLHFDHTEVGDDPLGHILENRDFRGSLLAKADSAAHIAIYAPASIKMTARDHGGANVTLDDGRIIRARVILACDGRGSRLRADAGIPVTEWRYNQSSFVSNIAHQHPHQNIAHERFLPGGPFAILPMRDLAVSVEGASGRLCHAASIVWSEDNDLVPAIRAFDDAAFTAALAERIGGFLGEIVLTSPRWVHPLGLSHAARYIDQRFALVGDAAHAIHPIAGQGLNMGIRDVAALAEVIVDARRLGRDIGDPDILADYERWRRFDNMLLAVVTDNLTRLFSNNIAMLRFARDLGLGVVNAIPAARKLSMRHAMGVVGDLPRLMRGEAL